MSALPRYEVIKRFILDEIKSGRYGVHHRVPSENELSVQFSVSRMTARKALQDLTETGILIRSKGIGTFVAEPKAQSSLLEIKNIAEEVRGRGCTYTNKILEACLIQASEEVAFFLGLSSPGQVMMSVMIHYENDLPIRFDQRYVNPAIVPEYLTQDFSQITPSEYLSKMAPVSEAEHIIEAVLPDEQACQALQIPSIEPCLLLKRRTWSGQSIISYSRLLHPSSRYRLGGHIQLNNYK